MHGLTLRVRKSRSDIPSLTVATQYTLFRLLCDQHTALTSTRSHTLTVTAHTTLDGHPTVALTLIPTADMTVAAHHPTTTRYEQSTVLALVPVASPPTIRQPPRPRSALTTSSPHTGHPLISSHYGFTQQHCHCWLHQWRRSAARQTEPLPPLRRHRGSLRRYRHGRYHRWWRHTRLVPQTHRRRPPQATRGRHYYSRGGRTHDTAHNHHRRLRRLQVLEMATVDERPQAAERRSGHDRLDTHRDHHNTRARRRQSVTSHHTAAETARPLVSHCPSSTIVSQWGARKMRQAVRVLAYVNSDCLCCATSCETAVCGCLTAV